MPLKSAYELASERVIEKKYYIEKKEKKTFDFIEIPEFSNRSDVVFDENETESFIEAEAEHEIVERKEINMEVIWHGQFFDYGGFARMNRTMAFGLSNKNVKVKIESVPYLENVNDATKDQIRFLENIEVADDAPKVYGVTMPTSWGHSGKKILYTMIESSEKVHKDYAEKLNMIDEIWVPTKYGKNILNKSNVYPQIYVMPLGVDIDRYCYREDVKPFNFGKNVKNFRFLSVFKWSYRKGFDLMLKAYLEEFSSEDDVSLIMVSRLIGQKGDSGINKIVEDFNGIAKSIGKKEEDLPHVVLHSKPVHEREMPNLYNSVNAFVLLSRGEGYCLPVAEAASCGLPVLSTFCTAMTDYLNDDNSFLVYPERYVKADVNGQLSHMAKLSHFFEGQIFPDFGKLSIEKAKNHMRDIYENYSAAQRKANKLRDLIRRNYTWDRAVDKVYNRLYDIHKNKLEDENVNN